MSIKFNITILIIGLTLSCNQSNETEKTIISNEWNFFSIQTKGEEKESSYTFCSTTPIEIDYKYRIGKWSFYTRDQEKIAEGEYDIILNKIDNQGGCSYSLYVSSVDLSKWKFWDIKGNEIESTSRLRELIKYETNKVQVDTDFWSDLNRKYYKIDTTEFEVIAQKHNLQITLEREASFNSQMTKLKTVIDSLKYKTDLAELKSVFIWANNIELLSNISEVPEIQADLKRSELENGIVNSMGIVSKYAFKSSQLNEITNLFSEFNLSSYNYIIDKCYVDKRKSNSKNYVMGCATIIFRLKK